MASLFITPEKIYSGESALDFTFQEDTSLKSHKRALIVCDQMMVQLGYVDLIIDKLHASNIAYALYDKVNQEPTDIIVMDGVTTYQEEHCDMLLAIGGGSPIDTMKAIAIMIASSEDSTIQSYSLVRDLPMMMAIPTTAGTGSEATQFTIITDTKNDIKMLISNPKLIPNIAIIDPQFTISTPKHITSTTGIDALCHAIESYISKKAQPLSQTFSLSAIKRILNSLYTCYIDGSNQNARAEMALASLEAGIAFNNASVTLIHAMSRPIGALFHVNHGLSNSILLHTCLQYLEETHIADFAKIARYCQLTNETDDTKAAHMFITRIQTLLIDLEIPTFKELAIDPNSFKSLIPKMSKDAMDSGSPSNLRCPITQEDVADLYIKFIA